MGVTNPPGFWLSNRKKQPEVWELMVVSTRFLASGWILYEELLANPSAILEGIFETKITGEWRVCDLTQFEQEAKEKTKKSQSGHAEVALGGSLPRIPGDEQRHRDLHFHRELS